LAARRPRIKVHGEQTLFSAGGHVIAQHSCSKNVPHPRPGRSRDPGDLEERGTPGRLKAHHQLPTRRQAENCRLRCRSYSRVNGADDGNRTCVFSLGSASRLIASCLRIGYLSCSAKVFISILTCSRPPSTNVDRNRTLGCRPTCVAMSSNPTAVATSLSASKTSLTPVALRRT
jgi:hypothetical protein